MTIRGHNQGFTLIEIALALLVTSIGVVGLFTLLPAGVHMNKTALDETQAAMFAEQVLNGVRAQAATSRWDQVRSNIKLPPPTPDVWANKSELSVQPSDSFITLVYKTAGALGGNTDAYTDFGLRYALEIQPIPNSLRYAVRLQVRPGEFGTTNTYVFYTEIYNHG